MIWHKKLRELANEGESVYRVAIPAHKQQTETGYIYVSGHEEIFATFYQAESYTAKYPEAKAQIFPEPATLYV